MSRRLRTREPEVKNERIKRVVVRYELKKYLGHEVHYSDSNESLVYCDTGEVAWFTNEDVLMVLNRGIDSCLQNTKIEPERRKFNFKQMNALKVAGEQKFTNFLNPKKLSIGQILWIDNNKNEDDIVVIQQLTDCAIKIQSSRPEFNDTWLPFFSLNFLANRTKLSDHCDELRLPLKDFTLVPPIRKFHYIPIRRHTKIERAYIPPFDALDHLLMRRDYPVNLSQPTITIYHDSKKRQTDSQVERKFKKLRV